MQNSALMLQFRLFPFEFIAVFPLFAYRGFYDFSQIINRDQRVKLTTK